MAAEKLLNFYEFRWIRIQPRWIINKKKIMMMTHPANQVCLQFSDWFLKSLHLIRSNVRPINLFFSKYRISHPKFKINGAKFETWFKWRKTKNLFKRCWCFGMWSKLLRNCYVILHTTLRLLCNIWFFYVYLILIMKSPRMKKRKNFWILLQKMN